MNRGEKWFSEKLLKARIAEGFGFDYGGGGGGALIT